MMNRNLHAPLSYSHFSITYSVKECDL